MTEIMIYLPFPKRLYDDIVRLSNGTLDPALLAVDQVMTFIERNLDDLAFDWFGDRLEEFAERHFPDFLTDLMAKRATEGRPRFAENLPLVWKEVTVPHGADVRMQYGGTYHYAAVRNGSIEDSSGRYSPSEWSSKIAMGTSRNAWKDIWFKEPLAATWVPASLLRQKSQDELKALAERVEL